MKFRTEIKSEFVDDIINYNSKLLSIGSCFADNVGNRLKELQFSVDVNPFGILFSPLAILNGLKSALNNSIDENLFVQRSENWYHYHYHSNLSGTTKTDLINKINHSQNIVRSQLEQGNVLAITFGTAWVYRHLKSDIVVANCHKVPQQEFHKELAELEFLKEAYKSFFNELFQLNPNLKIVLTVSPVRHIKDGLHENNLSKSVLLLLANFLSKHFKNVIYFPSYELILDDLRDYRFFKEDLIHPTDQAIDYVFEHFTHWFFSEKTRSLAEIQKTISKAENHRFLNASSDEKKRHQEKIEALKRLFADLK